MTTSAYSFDLSRVPSALDMAGALERVGDDMDLLGEMLEIFLRDAPTYLRAARSGLSDGALDRVARAAHSLRGTGAQLGADALATAALEVERSATSGAIAPVRASLAILENTLADLFRRLGLDPAQASTAP